MVKDTSGIKPKVALGGWRKTSKRKGNREDSEEGEEQEQSITIHIQKCH